MREPDNSIQSNKKNRHEAPKKFPEKKIKKKSAEGIKIVWKLKMNLYICSPQSSSYFYCQTHQ